MDSGACGSELLFLCLDCGLRFEAGISDNARGRGERCPQCGLEDVVPIPEPDAEAFVVRRGTKFR